jgi:hypothetical protein
LPQVIRKLLRHAGADGEGEGAAAAAAASRPTRIEIAAPGGISGVAAAMAELKAAAGL